MKFSVFIPGNVTDQNKAPCFYWLSGLTCTEDNFFHKSGFFKYAAEHSLVVVACDTSPRGLNLPGEKDSWDFGEGAGFYVNATQSPWADHYRMYDYVNVELPSLIEANFPVTSLKSISGHSMGGHGALISFLKNPGMYQSVSAFAPICNPINCDWGKKAFTGYLGADQSTWSQYDATELIKQYKGESTHILIDQGSADSFLSKGQLRPESLVDASKSQTSNQITVNYRLQDGYDHSYFFISTFIEDHIIHAAKALKKA